MRGLRELSMGSPANGRVEKEMKGTRKLVQSSTQMENGKRMLLMRRGFDDYSGKGGYSCDVKMGAIILTLTVLVMTIDALGHF